MTLVVPPIGMRPFGFFDGIPRTGLPIPPVIRADFIDPKTQEYTSVAADFDPVDAAVIECLWRVRGSGSAAEDTGARFLDIDKVDERIEARVTAEARTSLGRLVKRGDITITKIIVESGLNEGQVGDWSELVVEYINNRAAKNRKRTQRKRLPESLRK